MSSERCNISPEGTEKNQPSLSEARGERESKEKKLIGQRPLPACSKTSILNGYLHWSCLVEGTCKFTSVCAYPVQPLNLVGRPQEIERSQLRSAKKKKLSRTRATSFCCSFVLHKQTIAPKEQKSPREKEKDASLWPFEIFFLLSPLGKK